MSQREHDGEQLFEYAMSLYAEAGHISTCTPEFYNHSAEQFVYFDNGEDSFSLTGDQRWSLSQFNNVSRLFSVGECVFFSINLLCPRADRSQCAHDIHSMIHPIVGADATICLFRHEDCVIFSFEGFGFRCVLSDWYPICDESGTLNERLDIANMSINNVRDYYLDFVYIMARSYYFNSRGAEVFSILPIDFFSRLESGEIDRDDINQIVEEELTAAQRCYGDDYVEYDEQVNTRKADFGADIDLMLLQIDMEDDNPFGEEMEADGVDSDEFSDEYAPEEPEWDEYEFEDVDPEIFKDPTLMVKWLEKMDTL